MYRNNPDNYPQPSSVWLPIPQTPNVYQHKFNERLIEMHHISVRPNQHEVQVAFIEGRIVNQHPNICCLYFYNAGANQQGSVETNRDIYVFTDCLIDLQKHDWNQQNILKAAIALKRLIMTYGPFLVSKSTFKKNQQNQIKVWISQCVYKNKPDQNLASEQEMISHFMDILNQENPLIKYSLKGAKNFRQIIERLNNAKNKSKKGHKYTPSISMKIIEQIMPSMEQTEGKINNFDTFEQANRVTRAKSSSPDRMYPQLWNSKQFKPTHKKQPSNHDHMSHRTNPSFNSFYNSSRLQSKRTFAPTSSQNYPMKNFPITPQPGSTNFNQNPFFSSKKFYKPKNESNDASYPKFKTLNGITIINNNVNNYYQGIDRPQYSRQISKQRNSDISQIPSFNSAKESSSPNKLKLTSKNKQNHQKSVPSFIACRKKMYSQHSPNNVSSNLFRPFSQASPNVLGSQKLPKTQNMEHDFSRKNNKVFTFCNFEKESHNKTSSNCFQTYTPKETSFEVHNQSAFKKNRVQSNYFPAKKMIPVNSIKQSLGHEIDMAQSKAIMLDTIPDYKKDLQRQYGLLLNFDFVSKHHEQPQQINTETLLKEKIKKKQLAFAQLKKQALQVLID